MAESERRGEVGSLERRTLGAGQLVYVKDGFGGHGAEPATAQDVAASLAGRVTLVEQRTTGDPGLRTPQIGALHALLAQRTLGRGEPSTVVLPTGTGKTDTMIACFCLEPVPTLIVVPSDSLRTQIGEQFAALGNLPGAGVLADGVLTPVVALLKKRFKTVDEVDQLLQQCNVLVTTAAALAGLDQAILGRLVENTDQLFVDEAHHVVAKTWAKVVEAFAEKRVVQFTATPFREDGQRLPGRIIYAYPLQLAQEMGYFAPINYISISSFAAPDEALAAAALAQLRTDLEDGHDHILMARVKNLRRAAELVETYRRLAPDLSPVSIDSRLGKRDQKQARDALADRLSRIVICVDMLGEGFDFPQLKVAAIHDPHRSLAVTLQFIGRFTRTGGADLGEATAFVPRQLGVLDDRLRRLYAEDSDWNMLVRDLSSAAVESEREKSEFDHAFTQVPDEIAIGSLRPKMSTVVYLSDDLEWNPDAVYDLYGDRLYTRPIAINHSDRVLWFVTAESMPVPWGDVFDLSEVVHHFHLVHCDLEAGRLYINSSNNDSVHEALAKAVGGEGVKLLKGTAVYRILSKVGRRVPTNIGLIDAVNRNRRFTMLVGDNVIEGFDHTAAQKTQTNISAYGYAGGSRVSFSAARKGRVWSHAVARNLLEWVRWATDVGDVLTNDTITFESVMDGFLIPTFTTQRPPLVALGIEWHIDIVWSTSEYRTVLAGDVEVPLIDLSLVITDWSDTGPIKFAVVSEEWSLPYSMTFDDDGPRCSADSDDAVVRTRQKDEPLSDLMNRKGMAVYFTGDAFLAPDGHLLRPRWDLPMFDPANLEVIDWTGIDIRKESQGPTRDATSIQYRVIEYLGAENEWDLVIDDDGTGEMADVVLLKHSEHLLEIMLVHCKYSHGDTPGARVADVYEVCGQAAKCHNARAQAPKLIEKLIRRERMRQTGNGISGLVRGTEERLLELAGAAYMSDVAVTVVIAQPGISQKRLSNAQAEVLASTSSYLSETHGSSFRVLCSP